MTQSPSTHLGTGVRIHSGLGVSDPTKKPNIRTRLISVTKCCLLNRRSPYTNQMAGSHRVQLQKVAAGCLFATSILVL